VLAAGKNEKQEGPDCAARASAGVSQEWTELHCPEGFTTSIDGKRVAG
jgi:hypothetical protein